MIDHTLYPHIFDSIVAKSPPESLLALRAASKGMRDRADGLLFKHVEVVFPTRKRRGDKYNSIYPNSTIHVAVRPFGSNLRFEWLRCKTTSDQLDGTVTLVDFQARAALRTYVHKRVTSTSILDVPCHAFEDIPDLVFDRITEVLHNEGAWEHVLVRMFGEPHYEETSDLLFTGTFKEFGTHVHFGDIHDGPFGLGYRRLARALGCRPGDVAEGMCMMVSPNPAFEPTESRELVVHLLQTEDKTPPLDKSNYAIIEHIVLTTFIAEIATTVVGGGQECRTAMKLSPNASQNDLYAALATHAIAKSFHIEWPLRKKYKQRDVLPWIRRQIRFLTPDEYEAEVGSHQFALETKPNPYEGPPAVFIK